ncbi:hypothetical protein AAG906_020060 [Vitis piasezkii]
MDVKIAFLNGGLEESIYMMQQIHSKGLRAPYVQVFWLKNMKIMWSQDTYIDKLLVKYVMQDFKKGLPPFRHGATEEKDCMKAITLCFCDVFLTCFRVSGSLLGLCPGKHDMM